MTQRITQRYIQKRYDAQGIPFCAIPICKNRSAQWKNGNYKDYCKDHNGGDMRRFVNWGALSQYIIQRDGKCVECGDDRSYIKEMRNVHDWDYTDRDCFQLPRRKKVRRILETVANLQADHIIEVADGGDMWDENNLQTLCLRCHRKKTAASTKKRRLGKSQTRLNHIKD